MKNCIISKKLQDQLSKYQSAPYEIGQSVLISKKATKIGGNSKDENEVVAYEIININGDDITVKCNSYGREYTSTVNKSVIIKKVDDKIGVNPFSPKRMPRITYYNIDLWQLLTRCGFELDGSVGGRSTNYTYKNVKIQDINFDPFVYDKHGVKQYYQRNLIWKLGQKQNLIHSIYNERTIGTFLLRNRGYKGCVALIDRGETDVAFYDMVDGKQRFNAILDFIRCEFPDKNGNYFGDFSEAAKRQFLAFDCLSFGLIEEGTPDRAVFYAFLNVNIAGTPLSTYHLDKVKAIEM